MKYVNKTLLLVLGIFLSMAGYAAEQKQTTDVRVIIDVSGSMKQNDPENLRVPALKLLIGLLPEGVEAGVWTFGTNVKPLIKHGVVNKKWKEAANKSVNKITSRDLYTDIEKALITVSKDWQTADLNEKRNIILLTDGMIDISKQAEKNAASKENVLDKVLPGLRKAGVSVNTVSLSENADLELNDALALGTDGWAELVNNAEQLQRVFLHMFEKSAPRDTVPLNDNQFTIDKLINEFTLLVFRKDQDKVTSITTPEGISFERESRPEGVAWLEETGYDMVTISKPMAGVWKINADIDPDNRVMVVTKLKLHTEGLPNSIFMGETYTLKAWMTAADKPIEKEAFYNLVDVKLLQHKDEDIQQVWEIEQRDSNNRYVKKVGDDLVEGRVQFSVIVDGKTFKREHKQTVNVYESVMDVEVKDQAASGAIATKVIRIKPKADLIDVKTLSIDAKILTPDGQELKKSAKPALLGDEWLVTIKDLKEGLYTVGLTVSARSISGREISVETSPFTFGEGVDIAEELAEEIPEKVVEKSGEIDWMTLGIYLAVGNVVLFTLIGLVWFLLGKRKKKNAAVGNEL